MSENQIPDTFAALVDEAFQRAELISSCLPEKIDLTALTLASKLPFKMLSLRETLIHRFADLSQGSALALQQRRPISAATLTRGSMETFARLFEFYNFACRFFENSNLDELDKFLMNRLFGARNREPDWPLATNILGAIDKVEKAVPHFRENYDRLSELAHPNYLGGVGAFQEIDRANSVIYFRSSDRTERAMYTTAYALVGTQEGFEKIYNGLEYPIRKLNDLFENGSLRHG